MESAVQERYKVLGFRSVSMPSLQGVAARPLPCNYNGDANFQGSGSFGHDRSAYSPQAEQRGIAGTRTAFLYTGWACAFTLFRRPFCDNQSQAKR